MKRLLLLFCILTNLGVKAQPDTVILDSLEQIGKSKNISSHFAQLYYTTTFWVNDYAGRQPDNVKQFIFKFESQFAKLFFEAHNNYINNKLQNFIWQRYYADTALNELQYKFMGLNAHINGDMWLVLKNNFSYDTVKKHKRSLLKFQKIINGIYDSIYATTSNHKKIKRLHFYTLGIDKYYGKRMMLSWRRRQIKLAMFWYKNPSRFNRKWLRIQNKMKRVDKFSLKAMV